jgi:hypothetical protein
MFAHTKAGCSGARERAPSTCATNASNSGSKPLRPGAAIRWYAVPQIASAVSETIVCWFVIETNVVVAAKLPMRTTSVTSTPVHDPEPYLAVTCNRDSAAQSTARD